MCQSQLLRSFHFDMFRLKFDFPSRIVHQLHSFFGMRVSNRFNSRAFNDLLKKRLKPFQMDFHENDGLLDAIQHTHTHAHTEIEVKRWALPQFIDVNFLSIPLAQIIRRMVFKIVHFIHLMGIITWTMKFQRTYLFDINSKITQKPIRIESNGNFVQIILVN